MPDAAPAGTVTRELSLPVEEESLDVAHDALASLLEPLDVAPRDRMRFETGLAEVLGNVLEHAFRLDADEPRGAEGRRIEVTLTAAPDRLSAVLGDNGRPVALDLSEVVMPDEDAESGRGLALAMAALDEVRYDRAGDLNTWTLVCLRHG